MDQEQRNLYTRVTETLRELFGDLATLDEVGGPIQIAFPGSDYLVCVWLLENGEQPLLRVVAPVAHAADWANPGLPEFLLAEQCGYVFGRLERAGEGIALEHSLFAAASRKELDRVVRTLTHTSIQLHRDLHLMGAIAPPSPADENAERGED